MKISTRGLPALKGKLLMVTLVLAVLGPVRWGYSQQGATPSLPAGTDVTNLRPGKECRVWLKTPAQPKPRSLPDDGGTIREVTKDEIVVTNICEGRNEYKTPVLGDLPFIGKYFTHVGIGRVETTSRIPMEKIARIEILEPDQPETPRR